MEKKRYEIQVAGAELAILSDEREEFVRTLVENLDAQIREITVASKRSSNLDAAILCALDYYSEKVKAEKRARNLEAQISLYDANLRRFREENIELRERLAAYEKGVVVESCDSAEVPAEEASADESEDAEEFCVEITEAPAEETEEAEEIKEEAKEEAAEEKADSEEEHRAARRRAIEELLGRQNKNN